jgi:SAM-dependent methyltransferase
MTMTFANRAQVYAEYRPRYPQELVDDIREHAVGARREHLLEWGCGTGELTLRLSPFFGRVTAIDLAPPMIAVARRKARRAGIGNVRWLAGRAEDLAIAPESCDLIASASAFHWMDRELLARRASRGLKPGGSLALVGGGGGGGVRKGDQRWHEVARECVNRHLDANRRREGRHGPPAEGHAGFLEPLGFTLERFTYSVDFTWDVDEAIGYLHSIGFSPAWLLDEGRESFEADLRESLLDANPSGVFHQRLDFYVLIAHKDR